MPPDTAALLAAAAAFHPWDAMAPAALAAIAARAQPEPFTATAETGCGGSTIVLSHLSRAHTAFAIEGENRTITGLRGHAGFKPSHVTFVEGRTGETLPAHRFHAPLDLVLLDGPHAYPLPQLEYCYLFPHVRKDGWLVLDDLQIPSVHELFRFLEKESALRLEEVVVRTAFFRRIAKAAASGPDDWWLQGINRSLVWRYSWRDRLRRKVNRRGRATGDLGRIERL